MSSKSCTGANKVDKEETMLVQDTNLELYYQLVFSSSFGDKRFGDNSSIVHGELFVSRMIYINPLCGIDKGPIANSVQMYVDCSSVDTDLELDLGNVDSIIRQVEERINNALYGYMDKASLVTLHLAIQSDTLTEDIARCFVYGIDPNQEFYPEEELLQYQLSLSNYKIFQNVKSCGFNVQIDYFHTFDTNPVLVTNEPVDESIFFNPLESKKDEKSGETTDKERSNTIGITNYSTTTNVMPLSQSESGSFQTISAHDNNSPWPKTESGALKASVVVYDMPDGNFSWKQTGEVAHPVLEEVSSVSGWISLGTAAVAGIALGVGMVVSAPAVATVAGLALFAAGVSSIISTSSSVANAFVYYAEGDIERGNKILLWEGISLGAGKALKYGSKFVFKNIKVNNNALETVKNSMTNELDRVSKRQKTVERDIGRFNNSNKKLTMEVEKEAERVSKMEKNAKPSKPSKRESYRRAEQDLIDTEQRNNKKMRDNDRKIEELQQESEKNVEEINKFNNEITKLQEMPSKTVDSVTSSGINVLHNSLTNNHGNNQE